MSTKRIIILNSEEEDSVQNGTYVIEGEGHSLGNALKSIISQYPEVDFCGYTVPNLLDNKITFKIQTKENVKSIEIFKRGLEDLIFMCDHILKETKTAMQ